jgi:HEAT repeat protein
MTAALLLAALLSASPARARTAEETALAGLRSDDAAAREKACAQLGAAETRGPEVFPALSLAMDRDLSEKVRLAAAKAVLTFPGDEPLARARAFLGSEPGPQTREDLIVALSVEPSRLENPEVTDLISAQMFDDPHAEVRRTAATALARRGDRRAIPAVKRAAVNDADKAVREAAKLALRVLSAPPPVKPTKEYKPTPPKRDAVKGKDPCPAPWGWCECEGPIRRPARCLDRSECRVSVDTMMQLGMPCSWNGQSFDAPK